MRKLLGILTAITLLVSGAVPARAATLTLQGDELSVTIGIYPTISIPGSSAAVFVSSGGGFTEPASVFAGSAALPTSLFTGLPLFSSLSLTVANATKVITAHGGGGGGVGGLGPLSGLARLCCIGPLAITIPLSPVGSPGGIANVGAAALMVTVTGHLWTTGVVSVTGLSEIATPSGFTNTVTAAGFDNRSAGHRGAILLVTPFRVLNNVGGLIGGGFATQQLTFVPEPDTLVLLGVGIAGLVLVGNRRGRR